MRPSIAALLLSLTCSAAHAETIVSLASIIDADTLEVKAGRRAPSKTASPGVVDKGRRWH
jgi:hypothetical protein